MRLKYYIDIFLRLIKNTDAKRLIYQILEYTFYKRHFADSLVYLISYVHDAKSVKSLFYQNIFFANLQN